MNKVIKFEEKFLNECSNIYLSIFNNPPWNDKWTLETVYKRLRDIYISPNFEGVICFKDNSIIGGIFGNCEQYYDGIHYFLKEMFVLNNYQGLGVGTLLMKKLFENLKKEKVSDVYLFTSKKNKTNEFYFKNEFEEFNGMVMMGKIL